MLQHALQNRVFIGNDIVNPPSEGMLLSLAYAKQDTSAGMELSLCALLYELVQS